MSADGPAGRLARGFNEWILAHGPDTDGARPWPDSLEVVHDGVLYNVQITAVGGQPVQMNRSCGLLNCTDRDHLFIVAEGD